MTQWLAHLTRTPSLDDAQYDAVINGRYLKSTFRSANGGCLSFTLTNGLIGFQEDKLSHPSAKPAPSSSPNQN